MDPLDLEVEPFAHDPAHWGASMVNDAELLVMCLEAAGARTVVEVGAYAGDLTSLLSRWAARHDARVWAIDPAPQPELVALAAADDRIELVRETSHAGLRSVPLPDVAILDGDHNHYTVSEELRIIAERAGDDPLPLLLFHDVCWPHGRRDDYFDPELIPADRRQPTAAGETVYPGESGVGGGGLLYRWPAAREGGPGNGVLTAVEDFVAGRAGVRLAVVPAFFGLGVVWDVRAPWSDRLTALLAPWDRNPVLERMEANRVLHLAAAQRAHQRAQRQEAVLRRLLASRAFTIAERLSRLRVRARVATDVSVVSKDEIRRALGD
jgi:hypothetical protein